MRVDDDVLHARLLAEMLDNSKVGKLQNTGRNCTIDVAEFLQNVLLGLQRVNGEYLVVYFESFNFVNAKFVWNGGIDGDVEFDFALGRHVLTAEFFGGAF